MFKEFYYLMLDIQLICHLKKQMKWFVLERGCISALFKFRLIGVPMDFYAVQIHIKHMIQS